MAAKKRDTKEFILARAEELVLQQSFAGTSIDAILEATELSKGAFFYHFKNTIIMEKFTLR